MTKSIKYIVSIIVLCFSVSSCNYLDIKPAEVETEDKVYGDILVAQEDLGALYHDILKWTALGAADRLQVDGPFNWADCASDAMIDHWGTTPPTTYFKRQGLTTGYNPLGDWDRDYEEIRKATSFINNVDNVPLTNSQKRTYGVKVKQYKQEARFLRAYVYFDLLRQYGAVPIITSLQDVGANKGNLIVARNSVSEVVNYICTELDAAADSNSPLPDSWLGDTQNYGRVSKSACLALKSRVLLYAASPLFNGNSLYKDIQNSDGKKLFSQSYDKEMWKKAADAADSAIVCAKRGNLYVYSPDPDNPVDNYEKLFYNNSTNPEFILASIQTYGIYEDVSCNSHAGDVQGWGRFSIMQNQVDAYETADGHLPFKMDDDGCIIYDSKGQPEINPQSGYKENGFTHVNQLWDGTSWQSCTDNLIDNNGNEVKDFGSYDLYNMYVNRDPRFYASITFEGAKFRNQTTGMQRCYHYAYWKRKGTTPDLGLQFGDGYPTDNTTNETGYGLRKFLNPNSDIVNWVGTSSNYPLFRMAELYLNKAEALNEYLDAPTQDVYDAINVVRARAGMPLLPITSEDRTKIGMRKRIRNERRVELFFEGHRFWDIKRWMVGAKCLNIPNYRMNSQPSSDELDAASQALGYGNSFADISDPWKTREIGTSIFYKRTVDVNCTFTDKMYLFPIPQTEIDKDKNLVQNYGW
ncbi:MAG: RagB/SusD family nutrient uptake outer membrane protein [Prevotella sp.]|nr:RagB/SusD family nutrient uptake outer membrane protein [Prevotella sp.]MCH4099600.1 RagB/SusD family nutrient uptake outer membrane protein [Prevotella sp.]MCI1549431.1 RagB/SusD family nutrient uptake outer membrane protein [Prevotella sp.]MCI1596006.1 RagB/SusD family nutrient uptake outer membrane protein [Prevotella sp.]